MRISPVSPSSHSHVNVFDLSSIDVGLHFNFDVRGASVCQIKAESAKVTPAVLKECWNTARSRASGVRSGSLEPRELTTYMREAQCVVGLWNAERLRDRRVSQPVTLRHKVSHSVTTVTPARLPSADSLAVLNGPTRNRQHGMTSAVAAVESDR